MKIDLNLRGREWVNPEGVSKYFNAIQGRRIELVNGQEPISRSLPNEEPASFLDDPDNDLPF